MHRHEKINECLSLLHAGRIGGPLLIAPSFRGIPFRFYGQTGATVCKHEVWLAVHEAL